MGFVHGEHVNLRFVVHHVPEVQARTQFQVAHFKSAFEQQNRAAPAKVAQALCLIQIQQGKTVGPSEALKRLVQAMAIGIGLDHGPHPRVACRGARARQVVGQGIEVKGGLNRARHVPSMPSPHPS